MNIQKNSDTNQQTGILYIVSTPIGNLQDITIRAVSTLFEVDFIVAEQTSKTSQLLFHLKNKYPELITSPTSPKLFSMNEFEEELKIPEILNLLKQGKNVALVSEAGTPLVSDPGFKLVREASKQGVSVIPIPGVSSPIAALTASGLPTDKFLFLGFPPKSGGKKETFFGGVKKSLEEMEKQKLSPTIIFFESPHRLVETLEVFQTVFGNIEITIARELTKMYEETQKGNVSEFISHYKQTGPKGEFVILFSKK